jgi:hypothetical protein
MEKIEFISLINEMAHLGHHASKEVNKHVPWSPIQQS